MFSRKKKQQTPPQPSSTPKPASKAPETARPKLSLLSLESRLMFDAAAAATASEVNQEQVAQGQAESAVSAEGSGEPTAVENESSELLQAITTYNSGESTTEVVFVDPTVPDYQTLIAGMGPNVEVVVLDGARDGMEQIAESLAGRSGVDAIHLISHGSSGELQLGTGTLNAESMANEYADELSTIRAALSDQADLLVYGCNFGEGGEGTDAVNLLAELTCADVAASSDQTGHIDLGGDWEFEVQAGSIETDLALTNTAQMNWAGILGTETVSDTFSVESYSNNNGTQSWSTSWSETDASGGGASGGDVRVNSSQLRIDTDTVGNAISRGVDLSGATSATLTFNYTNALLGADRIEVRVSTDGGTNYQTLSGGIFSTAANTGSGTASLDLSSYMSANTRIQFVVIATGGGERLYVDNVQVSYQTNNAPAITSNGGGATASINVAENTTTVTTVAATDADTSQALTYSISGGTDAAKFSINSSTGALSFASAPNYESPTDSGGNNVYDVTVQVSDGQGGVDSQALSVTVTNVANEAPTDLSNGVALNTDGGNDAYLISDTGLSQSLTATTVEIRFAANDLPFETVLMSFNNPSGDELSIQLDEPANDLELDFGAGSVALASAIDYRAALVDGAVHTLSVTWDNAAGNWSVYIDGVHIESGTGLNVGTALDTTNGRFVFGQEQDGQNSGYDSTQYFSGTFYDVRIWNDVRTAGEIAQYYEQQLDVTPAESSAAGLVANWQMDGLDGSNQVVELVSGNNLSIAHASGTGFTAAAVNSQLSIDENSANGSHVGFVVAGDPDASEMFSYSLTDSAGGRFAVDSITGEITVANGTLLNYESVTSHSVTVRVTDSGGLTYDETVTINLTNVAESSIANDDTAITMVNAPVTIDVIANDTDPEGDVITVLDYTVPANGTVTDNLDGTVTYTPDNNYQGADSFDYLIADASEAPAHYWRLDGDATDLIGGSNGVVNGTTTVEGRYGSALSFDEVNDYVRLPDVTYTSDFSISFMLKVDDLSGTSYQYLYSHGVFNTQNSINVFLGETGGTGPLLYTRVLDANDSAPSTTSFNVSSIVGDGQWHTYTLTISASDGLNVYLDGDLKLSDSARGKDGVNPSGDAYLGARQDLESTRFFGGSLDSVAVYDYALSASQVTDLHTPGDALATVTVTVEPNSAPTDLTLSANTVMENAANGTIVGTVIGTDPNVSDTKSYSFTDSAGGRFAINSSTGQITVADGSLLDYEAATSHSVTVRVTDAGGLTYDETFTINLTNVNETPTDLALSANTVAENAANGTVVGTVSGTDPDSGDTKTYSFTDSAGGRFAINSATGQITVADGSLLNYEAATSHSVTVRVTDAGGLTYDETFTINLTNVNETPTDLALSANTVAENAANGTVVGTITGTDPDSGDTKSYSFTDSAGGRFAINSSTGAITVANSSLLDYESATSHTVTVRVIDAGGLTYDETFTINLTNVNEAPTGADATITINEDTSYTLTSANFGFSDVDAGDSLSAVRIDALPGAGSLTLSGVAVTAGQVITVADITAGNLVFTPAANANGPGYASLTFSVRDSNNAYDAAPNTLTLDVTPAHDPPVNTVPGAQSVAEDTLLSLSGVSVTDVDDNLSSVQLGVLNGTVAVTLQGGATISAGSNGTNTLTLSGSQADINATLATLVYQGTLNFNGADTLTITSTDANSVSDVDMVAITVTAVDDATVVTGGTSGTGNEDTTFTGTLTATDAEGLSDGTVFTVSTAATNGTASIDPATGLWSYSPTADWNGSDSFTVTITDDAGNSSTQVISVTVTPVVDLTNDSLTTTEDTAISANVLTGTNGATADSFEGTPVLTSVTQGTNGTVTFLANGTVTYTPTANFNGTDSFTYTITSGGVTETATVTVTVTAVNDPTVVTGGTSGTGNEDTTVTGTLTATDAEGLADGTVFTVSANATNGTASIDPATGLWSYTPTADYNGSDSFTVTITDDAGNSSTQVISVTVTPVNDAPTLTVNTGSTVAEGGTNTIGSSELAVTDIEQTAAQLVYAIGTGPAYGRLELTTAPGVSTTTFTQADIAANRLIYIHNGSETTSDSFTFTVGDGAGGTLGTTTMTLTITPVNDTPTITSDGGASTAAINVAENVSAVTIVTGADVDLPAQAITYSLSGGADQALFTINSATGALSFTAPPDFEAATDANGDNVYVVQVQVTDSQGASTTQTIQVTVADVVEGVLPPPTPPPVLLPTTPPSPTGSGPVPSRPLGPAEPPTDALPQAPVLPDSRSAPAEPHPATVLPSPTERLVVIRPEEPRATIDEAKDSVLFPWIDEARRLLFTGLFGEPTPTPESEPAGKSQSVSDLLFSKLNEMTASLEQAMGVSQEQHVITVRIAALTGTTLSAGFIAWALRSGTLLASFMATMPAWRHFDPLPVLGGSSSERERRKKEAEQDQQAENTEFKGLKHLLDLGRPPDPKP